MCLASTPLFLVGICHQRGQSRQSSPPASLCLRDGAVRYAISLKPRPHAAGSSNTRG